MQKKERIKIETRWEKLYQERVNYIVNLRNVWKKLGFEKAMAEMEIEGSSNFDWDGALKKFGKELFK